MILYAHKAKSPNRIYNGWNVNVNDFSFLSYPTFSQDIRTADSLKISIAHYERM